MWTEIMKTTPVRILLPLMPSVIQDIMDGDGAVVEQRSARGLRRLRQRLVEDEIRVLSIDDLYQSGNEHGGPQRILKREERSHLRPAINTDVNALRDVNAGDMHSGTRAHVAAIEKLGVLDIHRRSFRPIREMIARGIQIREEGRRHVL
jgi:hypothetical protein